MARGVNKVIIVGNLGNDPEVRYSQQGAAIANISVATSEVWNDKNTGEQHERTEWHRIVLFNRLGEIAGEYLRKGSKVYIEGKLQTRKWQDQQGQDRYTTEIVANELQMLDSRPDGAGSQSGQYGQNNYQNGPQNNRGGPSNQQNGPRPGNESPQARAQREANKEPSPDFDDDIPF